jgi:hypothetical protein
VNAHFLEHIPLIGIAMIKEDGTIRWNLIIGGIITAGIIGMSVLAREVSAIAARQEMIINRVIKIEDQQVPATANRFTSFDADAMEKRIQDRLDRLEKKLDAHMDKR